MSKGTDPINPTPIAGGDRSVVSAIDSGNIDNFKQGLTKREYFAAMAMQGLLSRHTVSIDPTGIADNAICMADALLKQL